MSMFTRWSASVGMIVIACAFSVLHAQQQGGIPVRIDNEPDTMSSIARRIRSG